MEPVLSRRLRTINTFSHFYAVEVNFHDALFTPHQLDQQCKPGLKPFTDVTSAGPQKYVFGTLLRNSAASPDLFSFFVRLNSFFNGIEIKTVMFEIISVLTAHDGQL